MCNRYSITSTLLVGLFVMLTNPCWAVNQLTGENVVVGALVYNLEGLEFGAWGDLQTAQHKFQKALVYMPYYDRSLLNFKICKDVDNGVIDKNTAINLFKSYNTLIGNEVEEALGIINRILLENPAYVPAYIYRGLIYQKLNKSDLALVDYDKAIKLAPRSKLSFHFRGKLCAVEGLLNDAIADFTEVIATDENYAPAYLERGNASCHLGYYDEAITDYEKALSFWPQWEENFNIFKSYLNRGIEYSKQNQCNAAIADLNRALELNVRFAEPFLNRGVVFLKLNSYDKAIADFSTALEMEPNLVDAYYKRGQAFQQKGKIESAILDFEQTILLEPNHLKAHYALGEIFVRHGQYQKAVHSFEQVLKIDPNYFWAYYWQALAQEKLKKYSAALQSYNQFFKKVPPQYTGHKEFAEKRIRNLSKWLAIK